MKSSPGSAACHLPHSHAAVLAVDALKRLLEQIREL